ncbi:MAG: cellulose synthase family protein [Planctomycetota bacterium]
MSGFDEFLVWCYGGVLVVLGVYGTHRYVMVYLFYKYRHRRPVPLRRFERLPSVTVQLPVYNEAIVVARLIQAVGRLDYPRESLEIQVLDDSDDETTEIAAREVAKLRAEGLEIRHVRRGERKGFKAGALEYGLKSARGEFIAIFDADFVPPSDIVTRIIDHFTDPGVGMVQVRWGHLNREFSLLTRLQSIFLDGHFMIEHTARNRSGRFFNFNGTAGIFRRTCIEDAGGWQHDTLTEDLDLSYRAQLKGWKFVYLPDVISPAELPVEMTAFKSQQHRWAKGSIQTSRKILPVIWRSSVPLKVKLEATLHLTNNMAYLLMLLLCALMLPALHMRALGGSAWFGTLFNFSIFMAATSSVVSFYVVSQREIYSGWWRQLKYLPALLSLGIGLAVNNSRAVLEALCSRQAVFVRTPKYGVCGAGSRPSRRYAGTARLLTVAFELLLGVYFAGLVTYTIMQGWWVSAFFLSLFACGFLYVGVASLPAAHVARGHGAGHGSASGT